MVTTSNSLKYIKFVGGLTEKNICKWIESVDNTFGVVKRDKGTSFFHGDMVQSSYQLLNTLGLDKAQAEELLKPSFDYVSLIRNDLNSVPGLHFSAINITSTSAATIFILIYCFTTSIFVATS